MGGMDSTLAGQMWMYNLPGGFCNVEGDCRVLNDKVGLMFENGTVPAVSSGKSCDLSYYLTSDVFREKKERRRSVDQFLRRVSAPHRVHEPEEVNSFLPQPLQRWLD